MVLVGLATEHTPPLPFQVAMYKSVTIKVIALGTRNHARETLSLAQTGKVRGVTTIERNNE